jgi:diamine N-acetyltransferase
MTDQPLIIRKASPADAEFIVLLARMTLTETFGHLFRDKQDLLNYYDNTFSVQKIRYSISKENNIYWLAFWDELPVGYAKLKKQSAPPQLSITQTSQLQKIYILHDFINKKIGKVLLNEMLIETKKAGSSSLWLSVLKSNENAVNFYMKNGFTQVGKHQFQIGKEDFDFDIMVRNNFLAF